MEIRIETTQVIAVRINRRQAFTAFCGICLKPTGHLPISNAAAGLRLSETAVFRLVESGQIHSIENPAGSLFVCGNSVSDFAEEIESGYESDSHSIQAEPNKKGKEK